jgi:pimeloyl-ACP methyl ester carboxylesterase
MATYALIHGAYDVGWYWHFVERELQARGHRSVAPDLPIEDDGATLTDHAQVVVDALQAVHDGGELIVVGQSWGGYVAPIVADLAKADRLILVAPMVPKPGETDTEMWEATGWRYPRGESDPFYHDVAPEPWPLPAWPDVPTHAVIGRDDRFFPADWLRGVVRERLGIEPDELPAGHTMALSRPSELVELMESYRS